MRDKASYRVCSERNGMSVIAAEMRALAQSAAEPVSPGETVKAQQRKAWETLRRPAFWRLRAAWYGEAGCWSAVAVEDMRRRHAERLRKEAKTREQATELGTLFAGIAGRLQASPDAKSYRDDIHELLDAACTLGAGHSAVAKPDKRD